MVWNIFHATSSPFLIDKMGTVSGYEIEDAYIQTAKIVIQPQFYLNLSFTKLFLAQSFFLYWTTTNLLLHKRKYLI